MVVLVFCFLYQYVCLQCKTIKEEEEGEGGEEDKFDCKWNGVNGRRND